MKRPGPIVLILLFNLCLNVCGQDSYSFFIAGHPSSHIGVNPLFVNHFEYLNNHSEITFGVLLGDMVKANPTAQHWDAVDQDLDSLNMPIYFAAGNHDMEDRTLYESRYGDTYYHFIHNNDLFVVLDPNIDHWNISGEQFTYLQELIDSTSSEVDNIFVFFHQFLFFQNGNKYAHLKPNSFTNYQGHHNFWSQIEPLFHLLPNQVIFACGDFGAGPWSDDFMYDTYDNITFLGTGMGEGNGDNYMIINVLQDKSIEIDIRCLDTTNVNCFGELTNHNITRRINRDAEIYPNPSSSIITVKFNSKGKNIAKLYGVQGNLISRRLIKGRTGMKMDISNLSKGVYLLEIVDANNSSEFHKIYKL